MKHAAIAILVLVAALDLGAQGPAQAPPPRSAKEAAPIDLTGDWVSVVAEDWRWRMVTPLKGDFASVPVNAAGRKIGDAWDPAKDETDGHACKAYGAAAIMRMPGRVRISWQDDNTLRLELDAGTQTRLFHFDRPAPPPREPATWQGYSVANWERPLAGAERQGAGVFTRRTGTGGRALEVRTTRLRAGYLRKNGVPYSEQTEVAEYYDYRKHPNGDEWFTVTTVVRDPVYLSGPFVTSSDFKKEPDGSRRRPTPCDPR